MYSLEDALKKCDVKSLFKGILKYSDSIPVVIDEIDKDCNNYTIMRYINGTIDDTEHETASDNIKQTYIWNFYNEYIFTDSSWLDICIQENDIDNLISLRMILDENSKYIEKFDQLALRIFFEKKKKKILGLVMNICKREEYAWIANYISNYSDEECDLILYPDNAKYNCNYGCTGLKEDCKNAEEEKVITAVSDNNWIKNKYGE